MSPPKFRGGTDDWLDDEDASGGEDEAAPKRSSKKKKPADTGSRELAQAEANATVAEVHPMQCRVVLDSTVKGGARDALCAYKRSQIFGGGADKEYRERAPVAVGDRVRVESIIADSGVITGLCSRSTQLARPAPDRDEGMIHVIVANVEILVIVASAKNPDFSPGLVDRFLVAARSQGIHPILCVNKVDIVEPGVETPWKNYLSYGAEVIETSAKRRVGLEALKTRLQGRKAAFCGHSGVGKTSLLTALLGESAGKVGEVSDSTGKGRHTTTGAVLIPGPEHWIDTPGIREFGLIGIDAENLILYFPELEPGKLGCTKSDCRHMDVEGCRAESQERLPSYRRIYTSIIEKT